MHLSIAFALLGIISQTLAQLDVADRDNGEPTAVATFATASPLPEYPLPTDPPSAALYARAAEPDSPNIAGSILNAALHPKPHRPKPHRPKPHRPKPHKPKPHRPKRPAPPQAHPGYGRRPHPFQQPKPSGPTCMIMKGSDHGQKKTLPCARCSPKGVCCVIGFKSWNGIEGCF